MMAHVEVTNGVHAGEMLELDRLGSHTIGRRSANDLSINERAVSRKHCRVDYDGEFYWLVDCESHNGTFVNGRRVSRSLLYDGDEIRIGHVHLRFVMPQQESADVAGY
jgi:pSer/pThr/pTyr-binding forkhead associated (FHA) protein